GGEAAGGGATGGASGFGTALRGGLAEFGPWAGAFMAIGESIDILGSKQYIPEAFGSDATRQAFARQRTGAAQRAGSIAVTDLLGGAGPAATEKHLMSLGFGAEFGAAGVHQLVQAAATGQAQRGTPVELVEALNRALKETNLNVQVTVMNLSDSPVAAVAAQK